MVATAFAGMYGAWSYLQSMQQTGKGVKTSIALNEVATSVLNRVQSLLAQSSLTGACGPFNTALSAFRNFGTPLTPAQNPTTFSYPPTGTSPDPTGCLLKSGEIASTTGGMGGPVGSMTVTVQQNGAPDLVGLSSSVGISVTASTLPGSAGFHTVTLASRLVLKVSALSGYNLILMGPPSSASQLTINDSTNLEVMGSVLYADGTITDAPLNLGTPSKTGIINVPQGQVVFDQNFDIQLPSFVYINTTSTAMPLDLSLMTQVFKMGVNTNVMSNVTTLPINDPGVSTPNGITFTPPNPGTWQEDLDIFSVPGVAIPDIGGQVSTMGATMYGTGAGGPSAPPIATGSVTPTPYSTPNAWYSGWSGTNSSLPAPASMNQNTIPMPNPTATTAPLATLDSTCTPPAAGSNPPIFVFTRMNDNLSIDFTNTSTANTAGYKSLTQLGLPVFCGMVAANNITIYAPTGGTYWIFGLLIAKSVTLMGGGSVVLVNPLDGVPLASNPFAGITPTQTEAGVTQEMSVLGATIAHNFFVPVFQGSPLPGGTTPAMTDGIRAYRPHGPLRDTWCCGNSNTASGLDTADEVGYVCPCVNGSTSTPGTCGDGSGLANIRSPSPVSEGTIFCLASGSTALPTIADNQSVLFNTTTNVWQNLSFTAKVVQ